MRAPLSSLLLAVAVAACGGNPDPRCGDGTVDPNEACDDGNTEPGDACTSLCQPAACGDGFVQAGVETCDLGTANDDWGACSTTCQAAACGDGREWAGVEQCDLGADNGPNASCTPDCTEAACGDGYVYADLEDCDLGPDNRDTGACTTSCWAAACGDGLVHEGVEECDLGAMNLDSSECTESCRSAACGDGLVHIGVEECDEGAANGDAGACTSSCLVAVCGDELVQAGVEECDLGAANDDGGACTTACLEAACGDGHLQVGVEACDDGNDVDGDGCNVDCVVSGTLLSTVTTGGANEEAWNAIAVDPTGAIVVAGFTENPGQGRDVVVRKYDAALAVVWTHLHAGAAGGSDEALGVAVDGSGNVLAAGYETLADGTTDLWARKLTAAGAVVWTQRLDGGSGLSERALACAVNATGDLFYAGGEVEGDWDIRVGKLWGATGAPAWTDVVTGAANLNDNAHAVTTGPDNTVVVAGTLTISETHDVWVRKYIDSGASFSVTWSRTFNGADSATDVARGVVVDSAGDVFVAGYVGVWDGTFDAWVRRYDVDGNPVWTDTYDGAAGAHDGALGLALDRSDGSVVACGQEAAGTGMSDVWARKYLPDGTPLWTRVLEGPAGQDDGCYGAAIGADGRVHLAGVTETLAGDGDGWLAELAP